MTLSELLDALRSSPSLEALRQIPQPILIEWAESEWCGAPTPQIDELHFYDDERDFPRWYAVMDYQSRDNPWIYVCRFEVGAFSRLLALIESRALLLFILRARQADLSHALAVPGWRAEIEEVLC